MESLSQDSIQTKQYSLQHNPAPKLPVSIMKGQVVWLTAKSEMAPSHRRKANIPLTASLERSSLANEQCRRAS